MSQPRRLQVRALAKINLDLRVLGKCPDGYHEIRTIFQTISLADSLEISFEPARRTRVELEGNIDIPDNLVVRAAERLLHAIQVSGAVRFSLQKKIPMGGGLGGGSSDAAAVLLGLPVLAGRALRFEQLISLAAELGSDIPFFLLGGTAVGIGRGTELFPLPDGPARKGVLVAPNLHSSTAQAYQELSGRLTTELQQNKIISFQSLAWGGGSVCARGMPACSNDFEPVVFERFPELSSIKRRLVRLGARPALMSGSGSALFGIFDEAEAVNHAANSLSKEQVFRISLVSRARYRSLWWRWLKPHIDEKIWPPRSRYAQ